MKMLVGVLGETVEGLLNGKRQHGVPTKLQAVYVVLSFALIAKHQIISQQRVSKQ